ncbi:HD-GYP domain-containing protein [Lutispora sp.]|uniref:HD-GYP domain-containing protein n=1 Tax=Lutispora sp. TaxID=2828727 RepID=UPI003566609D
MRLKKVDYSLIGKNLGMALKTNDGVVIVNRGKAITDTIINKLQQYGFNTIYIEDDDVNITVKKTIPEDIHFEYLKKLNRIYKKIIETNSFDESELNIFVRNNLLCDIRNEPISLGFGTITESNDLAYHSLNVCLIAMMTGMKYGLDRDKLEILMKASLLHDIGKFLPDKYGKSHEQKAYNFFKNSTNSILMCNTIRFHHETIDGQGPEKLEYKHQSDLVKILSLCNDYENSITIKKLLPSQSYENIQALTNFKYDLKVFNAFKHSIYVYPIGLTVRLSNGVKGVVVEQNSDMPSRPIVKTENVKYDLMDHLSLFIEAIEI